MLTCTGESKPIAINLLLVTQLVRLHLLYKVLKQLDVDDHEVWGVNSHGQIWKCPVDGSGHWQLERVHLWSQLCLGHQQKDETYKRTLVLLSCVKESVNK